MIRQSLLEPQSISPQDWYSQAMWQGPEPQVIFLRKTETLRALTVQLDDLEQSTSPLQELFLHTTSHAPVPQATLPQESLASQRTVQSTPALQSMSPSQLPPPAVQS